MQKKEVAINQSNRKSATQISIAIVSILGLIVCIAVLFPQVRHMIVNFVGQMMHKEFHLFQLWSKALLSFAMGGIFLILFFDYCTLTDSGRTLVRKVKTEIKDCMSEIDFRSLLKPILIMSGVYMLGILTIIRANFLYIDDIGWSTGGYRDWYDWSRYVIILLSYIIQPEIQMTDISPIPQLLAVLVLACCSVLLVYILGNGKITTVRLLASIPLGLSPYFLECLSYKFMAFYMALSILVCIVPFLFVNHKKAFLFCSIISLLIMCMTYQAATGIYPMLVVILAFRYWNNREKTGKEILSFLGTAAFAFCFALLFFRFFLMIPLIGTYTSTAVWSISQMFSGIFSNMMKYASLINHDFGIIWKIGIALVLLFFIIKSVYQSKQRKLLSFIVTIAVIGIAFILSYGLYSLLINPLYAPRALFGFGILLAILCIIVVSDYKKIASTVVVALSWCFFVFAFSYGNALADQARYAEFRISILLHDLSVLYPESREGMTYQLKNVIEYAHTIQNIAKHYPIIERLVPKRLGYTGNVWEFRYFQDHFNNNIPYGYSADFSTLNLPVVLDSYYHTIQSDGKCVLILLKH